MSLGDARRNNELDLLGRVTSARIAAAQAEGATLRAGAVLPVDEERGRPAPGDGVYLLVTERGRARLSVALWKPLTPVASAASG